MKKFYWMMAVVCFLAASLAAEEARLLRFPHVSQDKISFVYAGDIYTAPRNGGSATRLTSHEGLELFPRFSPDGGKIAFTGQYDGDMSVYVMPTSGGTPTRLTYHPGIQNTSERFGPENVVMGWNPAGDKVLYRSRKELSDWWEGRVYLVGMDGGQPEPLPMYAAGFTSFSPDGNKVAYCPIYRDFRTWKRYKGGMTQDVWIFDLKNFESRKVTDWEGTDNLPMWYENRIYFNSDRTGTLNLYCYDLGTGETRQVTKFADYDVRWPSLGANGIAFENGGYVYVMDLPSETVQKVTVEITTDNHTVRREIKNVSADIDDVDIAPNAKRAVFQARGELFSVPVKDGNTRVLVTGPASKERYPRWSPDGQWVAYLSDISGEEEFYLTSHDGKETVQLTTGGTCDRYAPVWSPDSKKIAFGDKEMRLFYIEVDTKKIVKIDTTDRTEIRNVSWAPDSRYLAYGKGLPNDIAAVFVYSFDDNKVRQVTPGLTNDYGPSFSCDGKYLFFLSERSFNPILGSYEFSYVNNSIDNLYLIVLDAAEKSPFAPKSDEAIMAEDKPAEAAEDARKKDEKEAEEDTVRVKIDFDGIYERQVAVKLPPGNYTGLVAIPNGFLYMSYPIYGLAGPITQGGNVLHKYDLTKQKDHEFASGIAGYGVTAKGDYLLLIKDGSYYITSLEGEKASLDDGPMDVSKMEMEVDHLAEYDQMFNQVWRRYRDYFYDKNMHGVDWSKMRARYAPLIPHVANRYDLTYVLGEMVGELCCSHTYVGGGEKPQIPSSGIGLLGVDFEIDHSNNRIRIKRILDGENWSSDLRSPLREPGVDVKAGDYLLAINGHELTGDVNPYSLTPHTVGKQLTLTVNSKPTMSGAHDITVTPIASEESLRYFNWVEHNRKYVDSVSGGKIGYLHIPDMDTDGLIRFMKMFYNQIRRPGLIIDVRANGGGFVSGLILERLRRTVVAMGFARTFAAGPEPSAAPYAHMITLMNEYSCSDGDNFPYMFREYKLGPLMGKRTWGGVNGIRGSDPLVDGGYYTIPEFSIYNLKGEWVMENVGVVPDMDVDNPPDRLAKGFDDQLDRAIEYITGKLVEDPKILPPPPGPPTPR